MPKTVVRTKIFRSKREHTPRASTVRRKGKVMVLVHGAGHFTVGDFKHVLEEVKRRTGHAIAGLPALYTDVPSSAPLAKAAQEKPSESIDFAAKFRKEFVRDALIRAFGDVSAPALLNNVTSVPPHVMDHAELERQIHSASDVEIQSATMTLARAYPEVPISKWMSQITASVPRGIDVNTTIWETWHYLFDENVRTRIMGLVKNKLDSAHQQYEEVVLVSHSLGTVITFEILRDQADSYGKISQWFTLGCPLAKLSRAEQFFNSESNLASAKARFQNLGAISDKNVGWWLNLYDVGDLIADVLGPRLARTVPSNVHTDGYLIHDLFVKVGTDPMSSHDYFRSGDTLDMIARVMR